ncbi:4-(cytidine 5'-diphospho)-2-C-methyl-D-erythritol kinase [Gulbenkiania mobilis]|uniref:4-(cytidine 5'-diphospho)-2-C-methyl-D-erythritol kinase n=1 Tax=Gulbenkiania mobilis TaxID=397457 RepID=UPI0006BBF200|nr:4-(cytidine 5'-diphospho)-2-C-methyl-D-erythritol kinase [Gulbenkiania mobilis]
MSRNFLAFPAPAKLNLYLHIVGRRPDGYHLLDSHFRLIDLADTVEVAVRDDGHIELETPTPGVAPEDDLVVRAARCLQAATGTRLGASLRLTKRIPMGAGLGGGSSDAATVLMALNRLWETGLDRRALMELAVGLGADVPFFIFGRSARATGIGEILGDLPAPAAWYVVLRPPVHVPTVDAFKFFSRKGLTRESGVDIMQTLETTQRSRNDLQDAVCEMFPVVAEALKSLKNYGAPLMTGSGSCVFLACETQDQSNKILTALSGRWDGFVARGLNVHPLYDRV